MAHPQYVYADGHPPTDARYAATTLEREPYYPAPPSPQYRDTLGPAYMDHRYPTHHLVGRYDPYARPPQPRMVPTHTQSPPPMHNAARYAQAPVQHSGQVAAAAPAPGHVKVYETSRATDRYRQSRGAQRDAKWHARYQERTHLLSQAPAQLSPSHPPPPYNGRVPPPHPGVAQPYPPPSQVSDIDRIRAEQQAAIAQARKTQAVLTQQAAMKRAEKEAERKKRRIQLQVFVHARPTFCAWKGCSAVLNSWALLEKHLYHAHLQADSTDVTVRGSNGIINCGWEGCKETFERPEDCHKHCLIGHMGKFSARCPFDCLFEGPHFDDLMAHTSRRHPNATPDDFVPGLIHHRPLRLPRSVDELPHLPSEVVIKAKGHETSFSCEVIEGFGGERSYKAKRSVERNCFSGRRPRKDDFADKKGANAAISAFIENSRRISVAVGYQEPQDRDEDPPPTARTAPLTAAEAKEMGVDLVDISQSVVTAREAAKREVEKDVVEDASDSRSSRESSGGEQPKRNPGRPRKLQVTIKLSGSPEDKTDPKSPASSLSSQSDSDSGSETASEFRLKRTLDLGALVSPDGDEAGRKRSARLKERHGVRGLLEEVKV